MTSIPLISRDKIPPVENRIMEKMSAEKPGLSQGSFFISALKDFIAIMTAIAKAPAGGPIPNCIRRVNQSLNSIPIASKEK